MNVVFVNNKKKLTERANNGQKRDNKIAAIKMLNVTMQI